MEAAGIEPERGRSYFAGIDFLPPLGGIHKRVLELHRQFHPHFYADPYQAELLVAQLKKFGCIIETTAFTGAALVEMASGLVEVFASRQIELYPDVLLLADLRRLRMKESPAGWRLDAPRTAAGHCDSGNGPGPGGSGRSAGGTEIAPLVSRRRRDLFFTSGTRANSDGQKQHHDIATRQRYRPPARGGGLESVLVNPAVLGRF
jgi:hypothetical protein